VAFKKAIEVDPNYADAYYQYGVSLMGKATLGEGGKMVPVAGTGRGVSEVPGTGAQRTERGSSQSPAGFDRHEGRDGIR
jgi:hypothetical protein